MIKIFYLQKCGYSQKALETLEHYKIDHHKIDSSSNREERKKYYSTFPQIYWDDKLIGGYDDFTNIITTLQSRNKPSKPEGWTEKEWCALLLNIAEKAIKK
jgi:glutaredoxin